MSKKRIIARLDVKGPNLVKGIHLEGLRVLGSPADYARHYYEEGADELFYMDVVASLYERNSLSELVTQTAREAFVPLTVGGGIRTVEDIKKVLRAGADKVCINTGAVKDPEFIRRAVQKFGSSTVVVALECIRQTNGSYRTFVDNGREETGLDAVEWAVRVADLGAGELVITSVDREGTGEGLDIELIEKISSAVDVPVIAHGGVGKVSDIEEGFRSGADAVALASLLHYEALASGKVSKEVSASEGNNRFLKEGLRFAKIKPLSLRTVKEELALHGYPIRKTP